MDEQERQRRQREREERAASAMRALEEKHAKRSADLDGVMRVLAEDTHRALTGLATDDSPFGRRNAVRVAFAFIEGTLYQLRISIVDEANDRPGETPFTRDEIDALSEHPGWRVNKGSVEPGARKFLTFKENVQLTFGMIAKMTGKNRAEYGDNKWNSLQKAVVIRDGLVHPKRPDDLVVTNDKLDVVLEGLSWFREAVMLSISEWRARDRLELERLAAEQEVDDKEIARLADAIARNEGLLAAAEAKRRALIEETLAKAFEAGRAATHSSADRAANPGPDRRHDSPGGAGDDEEVG